MTPIRCPFLLLTFCLCFFVLLLNINMKFFLLKNNKNKIYFFVFIFVVLLLILFIKYFFFLSMRVGNYFFGGGGYNLNIAEKAFLLASKDNPPKLFSNYQLGRINFIKGNFYTAIDYFNEEERIYPENSKVHYMRGLTYGYMGNENKGIEEFRKYIEKNPKTWAGRNDMAWLQFRGGDIKGAIETIKPAIEVYSGNPWILNSYGAYLLNDGKYTEALDNFIKAKEVVDKMDYEMWGVAYPGNDPRVYGEGLEQMKKSIDSNISLVKQKIK